MGFSSYVIRGILFGSGYAGLGGPARSWTRRGVALSLWLCFWLAGGFLPSGWAQLGVTPFSWESLGPTPVPARVVDLAVDPRLDSILYLAAPGGGVWKSEDSGQTWIPQMDSAYSLPVCSLAIDAILSGVLYAGTGDDQSPRPMQGVARSADGGRTWNFGARFTNRPVCTLAVDLDSRRIFAGSAEGLFVSSDSGSSWRKVLSNPITSVAIDGRGGVYVGMLGPDLPGARGNILALSINGGLTWTNQSLPVNPDAAAAQTNWVSLLARGNTLYAIVSYQVPQSSRLLLDFYRSADGGITWTLVPTIGEGGQGVKLLANADATSLYVLGTTLLTSSNDGNAWRTLATTTRQFHAGVFTGGLLPSLVLAGEKGVELVPLVAGALRGVLSGLPFGQFLGVASDSSANPWAAGPAGLFGMTTTTGSWNAAVSGVAFGNVAAAPIGSLEIFAGANAAVFSSIDGGVSFASTAVIPPDELRAPFPPLVQDPVNTSTAFVAGQRLYRASDTALPNPVPGTTPPTPLITWTLLATIDPDPSRVVIALAISPSTRRFMYAATACLPEVWTLTTCPSVSGIWRSQNSGQTWNRMAAVPGLVSRLAVDSRQPNTVYAAIGAFAGGPSASAGYFSGDLLRSTDGGASWLSVRNNLPRVPIHTIVVDPTSAQGFNLRLPAQRLYVGTDAGVFVSFNAGLQWTALNSSLPPTTYIAGAPLTPLNPSLPPAPITALSLRQPGATLLAATFGRGIYRASVAGLSASLIANPLSLNLTLSQGSTTTAAVSLANVSASRLDWELAPLDSWLSAPQPTGRLEARSVSDAALRVSAAGLSGGTHLGRLQITTGRLSQNILVTLQVTAAGARMTIAGGDNATGAAGTPLPPFTVVVLDAQNAPLPGVSVNFAITSGGGSLSARAPLTDAAGRASTVLTLPNTTGTVQVVAAMGNVSVTFTATAIPNIPRPSLLAGAVVNGATFGSGAPLAPGSIVSIFGRNLAESNAFAGSVPLPTSLQTTRVLLSTSSGEVELPLFFVSPQQVNALLPYDMAAGVYRLSVEVESVRGNAVEVPIASVAPGIFTMSASGRGEGIALKEDGSPVSAANPALRGSVVTLFLTGLGAVDPPLNAGEPGASEEPLNRTVQTPRLFFDLFEAEVLYSGLAPGFPGLYQVNVRVPARVSPASNIPVSLTIGGVAGNRVTVAVQ